MVRALVPVVVGFAFLHLVVALVIPVFTDEAYYALWARHLAAGYYDHPPMIAYMIALGVSVFGETAGGIRAAMVLAMALTTLLVGTTAQRMSTDPRAGVWAAVLFNLGLLPMTLGTFATPDVPSMVFWVLAVWAAIKAHETASVSWWVVAGAAMGMGVLSKFTNGFLCVGLLGWLITTQAGRVHMRSLRPYVALLAFALVLMPYVWWNISLDWVGFERQGQRLGEDAGAQIYVLSAVALMLLLPTPLVSFFAIRQIVGRKGQHLSLLLWSMGPLVVFFLYQSLSDQINANWPAPMQAGVAILAGVFVAQRRVAAWLTAGVAAVLSVGFMALMFNPFTPFSTADNPANQVRGWPATTAHMQEVFAAEGITWIATREYGMTGMMAFQFQDLPVWSLYEPNRYLFRPPFPQDFCDAQGALIERARGPQGDPGAEFEEVGQPTTLTRSQADYTLETYIVTPVRGLRDARRCGMTPP